MLGKDEHCTGTTCLMQLVSSNLELHNSNDEECPSDQHILHCVIQEVWVSGDPTRWGIRGWRFSCHGNRSFSGG